MWVGGPNNNRDAEIAYNLFKGLPGGDWWDGLKGAGWGNSIGYDNLVRGTAFSIGAEYNDNVNALTSGIDLHHNLVAGNGIDMDFGVSAATARIFAICDTIQMSVGTACVFVWHRTGISSPTTFSLGARGLYGPTGKGHVYTGNYRTVPIAARSGDSTNEAARPAGRATTRNGSPRVSRRQAVAPSRYVGRTSITATAGPAHSAGTNTTTPRRRARLRDRGPRPLSAVRPGEGGFNCDRPRQQGIHHRGHPHLPLDPRRHHRADRRPARPRPTWARTPRAGSRIAPDRS